MKRPGFGYATAFRALADASRLRVVNLLLAADGLCGCELMEALQIPQYVVSRHLAVLRHAGLVTARKQGRWVYYSLVKEPEVLGDLWGVLRAGFARDGGMTRDAERLKARLSLREGGSCVVGSAPRVTAGYRRRARRPTRDVVRSGARGSQRVTKGGRDG